MVPPAGVEPATCPLGRGCSIQLSYGGLEGPSYLERCRASTEQPRQRRCSSEGVWEPISEPRGETVPGLRSRESLRACSVPHFTHLQRRFTAAFAAEKG